MHCIALEWNGMESMECIAVECNGMESMECNAVEWNGMESMECNAVEWNGMDASWVILVMLGRFAHLWSFLFFCLDPKTQNRKCWVLSAQRIRLV